MEEAHRVDKVLRGTRDVTARLAYSIARLTDTSIDDLLAGVLLPPGTCPRCGWAPGESEFVDEETVVEDKPRDAALKLRCADRRAPEGYVRERDHQHAVALLTRCRRAAPSATRN